MTQPTTIRRIAAGTLVVLLLAVCPVLAANKAGLHTQVMKRFVIVTSHDHEGRELFQVTFARQAAGISGLFDSRNDPRHRVNLVATAHKHDMALLSFELRALGPRGAVAYYPAAPRDVRDIRRLMQEYPGLTRDDLEGESFEVVSSGPVRTVMHISGKYTADGTSLRADPTLRYDTRYVVYASGHIFVEHSLLRRGPRLPEAVNLVSLNAAPLKLFKPLPSHEAARRHVSKLPTSFVLMAADAPGTRTDLLLVPRAPRLPIVTWGELLVARGGRQGYLRCQLMLPQPGRAVEPGKLTWQATLVAGMQDIDDREQARLVEKAVRKPAELTFYEGWGAIDPMGGGAPDSGFNYRDGAWHVRAGKQGVAFRMTVDNVPRHQPRLVVSGWNDAPPEYVSIKDIRQSRGQDYLVQVERVDDGKDRPGGFNVQPQYNLVIQLRKVVPNDDVRFVIKKAELDLPPR